MDIAIILSHVPQADPAFVQIVSRLPDPPADSRGQLLKLLPDLHRQFLDKRRAFKQEDGAAWDAVMADQLRLVGSLDRF